MFKYFRCSSVFFQALPQNLLHYSDRHPRESASQTTEHAQQPGETIVSLVSVSAPGSLLLSLCFLSQSQILVLISLRHRGSVYLSLAICRPYLAHYLSHSRRGGRTSRLCADGNWIQSIKSNEPFDQRQIRGHVSVTLIEC